MKHISLALFCYYIIFTQGIDAQTRIFPSTKAQFETPIAVNPTDPNNLVAAAITGDSDPFKIGYYYSFNGGQTWGGSEDISGPISAGDPVVAFDPDGVAYLLYQVVSASDLYLHKSTDGGTTWSNRVTVRHVDPPSKVDRSWMAVSPIRNAVGAFDIFVSHTSISTTAVVNLLKSTDGGSSFSAIFTAEPLFGYWSTGSSVVVGSNGDLFLTWAYYDNNDNNRVKYIEMQRSTDGGSNWGNQNSVQAFQIGVPSGSNAFVVKASSVLADSYPRIAVDAHPGNTAGTVYIAWSGKQSADGNPDILMVKGFRTTNSGFTWSNNIVLDGASDQQFMPSVSVTPDSVVSVLYYSSGSLVSDPIYTYLKYSTDGGQNFLGPVNVGSAGGFVIPGSTVLGDYHGLASWFGKAYAVWCEFRNHGTDNNRQAYFRSVALPELTPPGYKKIIVDQIDESSQSFEKFGGWNQGVFSNYKAPYTFLFQTNSQQVLRAKQDCKTGTIQKYNKWDLDNDVTNHRSFPITVSTVSLKSQFKSSQNGTVVKTDLLDAPGTTGGSILFKDPWLIDFNDPPYGIRNQGSNAPFITQGSPFVFDNNPQYKGVFLAQDPQQTPNYYSIKIPLTQTINSFTSYFQNWSYDANKVTLSNETPPLGYDQKSVVFKQAGATLTAQYKAHLGTNAPSRSDAKNQRRVVSASGWGWAMVYESLGDVWVTYSSDNGATWGKEERLNTIQGAASNPTISNVFSYQANDYKRIIVSWLEQNGSTLELHLQTMILGLTVNGHWFYGWVPIYGDRSTDNHKLITFFYAGYPATRTDARPVLQLDQSGNNVMLVYAYEAASTGIIAGKILFEGNGYNTVEELAYASMFPEGGQAYRTVSTSTGDSNPVIISYPSVYGYPAITRVYFLGVGYASGRRVVQYDFGSGQSTALGIASGDYTYYSLQGAANFTSASFGLVSEAYDTWGRYNVNYYYKPTYYGSSNPSLATTYTNMRQPTLMVENVGSFGSPAVEIDMVSTGNSTWYKAYGSTDVYTLGTNVAGMFTRAQVGSGDRASVAIRNNVTPARLEGYSGSGILSKSAVAVVADVRAFRFWNNEPSPTRIAILDFSGATVNFLDTLEEGQNICAVQVLRPSDENIIARQPDSTSTPLQVDLLRDQKTVKSFAPIAWNRLTTQNIPGFLPGDVVRLKTTESVKGLWGYEEVTIRVAKDAQKAEGGSTGGPLTEKTTSIVAYPNPFNPATRIDYHLKESGIARLVVYDVLGREVAVLVDSHLDAGDYHVVWNANDESVASGVYFARFTVTDELGVVRFNKVNKLLLMK